MIGSGMSPSVMTANPPYIRFETQAVEKRKTLEEGGEVYHVDTVFAYITPHGSKDTRVKVAEEWFAQLKEEVRQQRFPAQWLESYRATYNAWKNDQEPPVHGTAIKNWAAATPAEIKNCAAFGIRAVEDLANANEELIHRLGMGGRSLCKRAKDYIQQLTSSAPLVKDLDSMRHAVVGLQEQVSQLLQQNTELRQQLLAKPMPAAVGFGPSGNLESRLQAAKDDAPEVSEDDVLADVLQTTTKE